jgi:hypothetical protein
MALRGSQWNVSTHEGRTIFGGLGVGVRLPVPVPGRDVVLAEVMPVDVEVDEAESIEEVVVVGVDVEVVDESPSSLSLSLFFPPFLSVRRPRSSVTPSHCADVELVGLPPSPAPPLLFLPLTRLPALPFPTIAVAKVSSSGAVVNDREGGVPIGVVVFDEEEGAAGAVRVVDDFCFFIGITTG